jgi:hypothetical protein
MKMVKPQAADVKEKLIPVSIRLPESLHKRLADAAAPERRSLAAEALIRLEQSFTPTRKK